MVNRNSHTDRENKAVGTSREGRAGGRGRGLTHTLLCIKQVTNENRLCSTGRSSMLYGDLNGEEIQKDVQTWLIHVAAQQKLTPYCKATILQ